MTRKELAKLLQISPASLSLVLNHKPGVSESTRRRVLTKVEELGYSAWIRKNERQSDNLCLILYKKHSIIVDQHPFILQMIESVENRARKYGLSTLMSTIDSRQPIMPQIERINGLDARGAVVCAVEMDQSDLVFLHGLRLPFICMSNDFSKQMVDSVLANNDMGAHQAIEYLVSRGHSQIGYLRCSLRAGLFQERHNGFTKAMAECGYTLNEDHIVTVGYSEQQSYLDFRSYLQQKPTLPTAFVADDDSVAAGAMKALKEAGFRVPEDVSLIGFGDRVGCDSLQPSLTSVNVSPLSVGSTAVDALMLKLEDHAQEQRCISIRVSTYLALRQSVCPHGKAANREM